MCPTRHNFDFSSIATWTWAHKLHCRRPWNQPAVPLHVDATATSHMGINIATLVFLFGAKEHRELSSHHATQSSALGATPNSPQRLRNSSEQLHSDEHPSRSEKCSTYLRGFGCSTRFSRHSFRSSFWDTNRKPRDPSFTGGTETCPLSPLTYCRFSCSRTGLSWDSKSPCWSLPAVVEATYTWGSGIRMTEFKNNQSVSSCNKEALARLEWSGLGWRSV